MVGVIGQGGMVDLFNERVGAEVFNDLLRVLGVALEPEREGLYALKKQEGELTEFSEKLWCGLLDYATAYSNGRLTFTFKNGSTFEG